MKWITRRNLRIDRTACAGLIGGWIGPEGELDFVPAGSDPPRIREVACRARAASVLAVMMLATASDGGGVAASANLVDAGHRRGFGWVRGERRHALTSPPGKERVR